MITLKRDPYEIIKRRQQGSNLRGRSPTDFKSVSLTTRTYRRVVSMDTENNLLFEMLHKHAQHGFNFSQTGVLHYLQRQVNI